MIERVLKTNLHVGQATIKLSVSKICGRPTAKPLPDRHSILTV